MQKMAADGQFVSKLPVEMSFATGRFAIEMRRFEHPCGHTELFADLSRIDGKRTPVIVLDQEDLEHLRDLFQDCAELAARHLAAQV